MVYEVRDKNIVTDIGIYTEGMGQYNFDVSDNNMLIRLYSYGLVIDKHEIDEKDRKELKKLIKMVNTKERIKWLCSDSVNDSVLYMYIRLRASKDKEFLDWWCKYNFYMTLQLYKSHKFFKIGKGKW